MGDNEKVNNYRPPRRNAQLYRPPPGVQKAMQTLGVRDLREVLDKKRQGQEHGESQANKGPNSKVLNLPPPDPSYNLLKDPTRDTPRQPPQKMVEHGKQLVKDSNRDKNHPADRYRDTYSQKQRHKDASYSNRDPNKDTRRQENNEHITSPQDKGVLKKNQSSPQSEQAPKKELRFADPPNIDEQTQFSRGGRHSFRGRNARRGGGISRETKEEKIKDPVNIKIELSIETGMRNCTLDENTKIPDIKHVPDNTPQHRSLRGVFRGGRGNFRSRGRGRGGFHGRGGSSYRGRGPASKTDTNQDNTINMQELQETLPDVIKSEGVQSSANGNLQAVQHDQENTDQNEEILEDSQEHFDRYGEYEQHEEYTDATENYENEFLGEYQYDPTDQVSEEISSESVIPNPNLSNEEDPNLAATITITSTKFQDGQMKRSVNVTTINNDTDTNPSTQKDDRDQQDCAAEKNGAHKSESEVNSEAG